MPNKLKKAIGAVKDQTSISLAKVSKSKPSNIEVIILKATRHDEVPVDDRYVMELLQLISSNKLHAVACAQVIAKRIGKTRNWIVALKSLMLILKIFQDGDPHFPREVAHAMKRGHKILNLKNFRDDSKSSPWDYTAFVRTFALFLDERLDCFLSGKLQSRYANGEKQNLGGSRRDHKPITDMKPTLLLDRISSWQRLLDRAIGIRPTGAAKSNKLVRISLYAVVKESFHLYRDIADAMALLLDGFFHLQYESCASAFQTCVKASKQFEDLCSFYAACKSNGIGRTSEYPSVQKVSEELIETLKEFLKDQASIPKNGSRSPVMLLPSTPPGPINKDPCSSSSEPCDEYICDQSSGATEREFEFEFGSLGTSPSHSLQQYCSSSRSDQQDYDSTCTPDTTSNDSLFLDQCKDMTLDILFSDEGTTGEQNQQESDDWKLMLTETAQQQPETLTNKASISDNFIHQPFSPKQQPYNPFLQDAMDVVSSTVNSEREEFQKSTERFSGAPTFRAIPTFRTDNVDQFTMELRGQEDDPFESYMSDNPNGSPDGQIALHEQQAWLQNQSKIIAKHLA